MSYGRIYEVSKAAAHLLKSNPPALAITASGIVNSSGWSEPQLTEWAYVDPPKDGILDLDFVAKKPTGIVLWALSPINADRVIENIDLSNYWGKGKSLKGVRVHGSQGSKEYKFGKSPKTKKSFVSTADRWPW